MRRRKLVILSALFSSALVILGFLFLSCTTRRPAMRAAMPVSAVVAAFGMILRDSPHKGAASLALVRELAASGSASDERQRELAMLIDKAQSLRGATR
jgi:hypothetical protein